MNISQSVQSKILAMPTGKVFGYDTFPRYASNPNAVVKAIGRLVNAKSISRLSKGKFYVPAQGLLGTRKPSDSELLRSVLCKDGQLRGYVTGLSLYNQLGLTTQVPRTITVAINGGRQKIDFGTIAVKTMIARFPIRQQDVTFYQYLDVLRDVKKIPDTSPDETLNKMAQYLQGLDEGQCMRLTKLALQYYSPQTRALLGLLLSALDETSNQSLCTSLKCSLNPTTRFKLDLDLDRWPMSAMWNIK